MERSFFAQVLDVFEGVVADMRGDLHSYAHRRGLKVWFDDANREHYEAQLIRVDGEPALEIGFHVEYPKVTSNDEVLHRLRAKEERGARRSAMRPRRARSSAPRHGVASPRCGSRPTLTTSTPRSRSRPVSATTCSRSSRSGAADQIQPP